MPVRIGKKMKRIEFKGGVSYPKRHGGAFITSNLAIQKALERRPDFGRKFKCVSSTKTRAEQEAENREVLAGLQIPDKPVAVKTEEITERSGKTTVPEVTKYQEAKNYLLTKFSEDLTINDVKSKVKVKAEAAKRDILFPNWSTE